MRGANASGAYLRLDHSADETPVPAATAVGTLLALAFGALMRLRPPAPVG